MMPTPEQFSEQVRELGVNDDSVVVVYDDKGIYSSARVWWMFKSMGFDQVAVLNGGLPAWRKEGFQCTVPAAKVALPKGNFTATGQEGYFCDVNRVLTALADPRVNVLDARSFSRFSGAEKDPRPGVRSGHMPGALNMHYASLFETEGERAGLMAWRRRAGIKIQKTQPQPPGDDFYLRLRGLPRVFWHWQPPCWAITRYPFMTALGPNGAGRRNARWCIRSEHYNVRSQNWVRQSLTLRFPLPQAPLHRYQTNCRVSWPAPARLAGSTMKRPVH